MFAQNNADSTTEGMKVDAAKAALRASPMLVFA